MSDFTQEDLVQYMYRETSERKTIAIGVALETDWDLRDSFEQFLSCQKNLEEVHLSPRNEAIDRILQHTSNRQGQLHSH